MIHDVLKGARARRAIGALVLTAITGAAIAQTTPPAAPGSTDGQTVPDTTVPETGLNIPTNLQIFGKVDPNVRKPTAIVNDSVITGTDVDQRVALIAVANQTAIPAAQLDQVKLQVLRQLIDETLQIQEAKSADVTITPDEIKQSLAGVSRRFNRTPEQMRVYLREQGSSERSLRRQIEGELAWQRYLRKRVEPYVNVGDEEVKSIIARLQASQGTVEYNVKEIYLNATPATSAQVYANAKQIVAEIQKGQQPFDYFATQFSEATTRAVGGDLGWLRASTLPPELSAAIEQMQVGQVAGPIEVAGGFSIVYLTDKRQVLTADPRDARLSLKQLTVRFPAGTTQAQASVRTAAFAKATTALRGCGSVDAVGKSIGAEVVDNDTVRIRDLPPALQEIMLKLRIGESTPPFGSPTEGVRALVLCGREDPKTGVLPGAAQVQNQLEQSRVNLRAQQKLRDLRRDAIVEYR